MRALAAAAGLATVLALPGLARAQVARPWFGIGIALPVEAVVPPGIGGVAAQRPPGGEPISLGYLFRVHARIGPRLLLHADVSAFHWFASESYAFPGSATTVFQTQAVIVPFDLGARLNVLPTLGPHQLLVGLGARATYAPWIESVNALVTGRGASAGVAVFAEAVYEVLFARHLGLEFAVRYAIGLAPQTLGTPTGRFDTALGVSTLSFAVGANYYF